MDRVGNLGVLSLVRIKNLKLSGRTDHLRFGAHPRDRKTREPARERWVFCSHIKESWCCNFHCDCYGMHAAVWLVVQVSKTTARSISSLAEVLCPHMGWPLQSKACYYPPAKKHIGFDPFQCPRIWTSLRRLRIPSPLPRRHRHHPQALAPQP